MKLWYEVQATQWSTPSSPARNFTVARSFRLDKVQDAAIDASIRYDGAAIYTMPEWHIIAEYKDGETTYTETGASR